MKTKTRTKISRSKRFAAGVGRALRHAAKDARKTARIYGTPLYVWEDGKVVAKEPRRRVCRDCVVLRFGVP